MNIAAAAETNQFVEIHDAVLLALLCETAAPAGGYPIGLRSTGMLAPAAAMPAAMAVGADFSERNMSPPMTTPMKPAARNTTVARVDRSGGTDDSLVSGKLGD
ncbi:hypothetical protein ACFWYX_35290 [[Kitasatospora] papulosa]|uniref:hypothetical protein n=1 Tax=[Kitasatospora] papulosa TaxID=1464011 RepID=UPI00369AA871